MVTRTPSRFGTERGALMTELLVAIAILAIAVLPIGYSVARGRLLARGYYQRAVAMEIVDGEMEYLLAGGWRAFPQGTNEYPIQANAATNLPDGRFLLSIHEHSIRLEWKPDARQQGGPVVREAVAK